MSDAWYEFNVYKPNFESTSEAVILTGYDTFFGQAKEHFHAAFKGKTYKTSQWIVNHQFPGGTEYSKWGKNDWAEWRQVDWTYLQQGDWKKDYLETINHNLNVAVNYCAAELNFIKDSYIGCSEGYLEEIFETATEELSHYSFMMVMSAIGVIASLLSISVSLSPKGK